MQARLLASEFLGKFGVFWSQLADEIEVFQIHLVTMAYGKGSGAMGKAECWTVVLTMVRVIQRELMKVRVEVDTVYGSENPTEILGQQLRGNLQVHRVIDEFLRKKFLQHPEVAPHTTLYIFEHKAPRVEMQALKQRVEAQAKYLNQMKNKCK